MFKKILIANRGEIACRVMKTARRMGIKTVAVYSDADKDALHVETADEAVHIGPAPAAQSYLVIEKIIAACKATGAEAVHPGYGFLSERAAFAEALKAEGIVFIGPNPKAIEAMGDKIESKKFANAAKVSTVPGFLGVIESPDHAVKIADEIGYPVMIKASAGGGGRGMRVVRNEAELPSLFLQASAEALAAFSNGDMYMEKLVENPRHIEFQILADNYGNVEVLGERECSIQRRHQKLVEESPPPAVSPELRKRISDGLKNALAKIGYSNAGTVEFLMNSNGELYFIEVNARIQVEHPVTEMVTGIDLVKSQIRVANGERLETIIPNGVKLQGHAIECRINAEHPETFVPSPGRITGFNVPGGAGVRVDTAAYHDHVIPPYYDSLVAKLICYGTDRSEAIARMKRALDMFIVEGVYTSIPLHKRILEHPEFVDGHLDTSFLVRTGLIAPK